MSSGSEFEIISRFKDLVEGIWRSPTMAPMAPAQPLLPQPQDMCVTVLYGTMIINAGVFGAWLYANKKPAPAEELEEFDGFHGYNVRVNRPRQPSTLPAPSAVRGFLERNFLLRGSDAERGRWWTLITSVFSHKDPMHFVVNMTSLYRAGMGLYKSGIPPVDLAYLMMGAGLAGSIGYVSWERVQPSRRHGTGGSYYHRAALGASGMVMGMLAAFTMIHPESENL